jgi:hypothetical protein
MIGISKYVADSVNGSVLLKDTGNSDLIKKESRVQSFKTLDNNVFVDHIGYCDGDRGLVIDAFISNDDVNPLLEMSEETSVGVATREAYFWCSIKTLSIKENKVNIDLIVREKLSD